jgi:SpoVK/Ycf46/Vps4 family AAA+-type ATPase
MNVANELALAWRAGTSLVQLVSREEARALEVCAAAAAQAGVPMAVWSVHRGLVPTAPAAKEPLALLDALASAKGPLVAVLLDFEPWLADPRTLRHVKDLLPALEQAGRHLVLVGERAELPGALRPHASVISVPLPDAAERRAAARAASRALAVPASDEDLDRIALVSAGLTAVQLRRCIAAAVANESALGPAAVARIAQEKRAMLAHDLGLEHVSVAASIEDLGGLESFKEWLDERAEALTPRAVRFGLPSPRGVLLLGVQGCGKSLAAKAVASRFGLPLVRLDLPRVLGAGGEGPSAEEGLRRALEAVEVLAPVAVWVDEIEKGFAGSRGGVDSRAARLLGAFSTWLQERTSSVFVVATANDVSGLPPELLRRGRFDDLFFVDLPDLEARRTILGLHLRKRGRAPEAFDLTTLAEDTSGFSGAELEQLVVAALHRAFKLGREPTDADLRHAGRDVIPLSRTYAEQIKELREWARGRARAAGREGAIVDLFRRARG